MDKSWAIFVDKMTHLHYDLCIIGGGINGAGIARDAAGRGLSVLLVDAADLAGATSSSSTKLIHGGLRYLEYYEFLMVRGALKEREVLYRNAPHVIRPLQCIIPQPNDMLQRPEWMLRAGLWLYDHLGGKKSLPNSKIVDFSTDSAGAPLKEDIVDGFSYYDCWVDDTRLVILNAVDAASRGARILTHTKCDALNLQDGRWLVSLRDVQSNDLLDISASMVVNATGPWVGQFLEDVGVSEGDPDLPKVRLVKGSHLILPRQYDGDQAYVLQQPDGRIVFVTPYEGDYTLIGTTEEDFDGDPRDAMASDAEVSYLCAAYNRYFARGIKASDAIFTFSGVRPLLDDGSESSSAVTRDYRIYHHTRYEVPLLSVYGGKLTTYRALSQEVVGKLMRLSGRVSGRWTAGEALIGGDFDGMGFDEYFARQRKLYPWLPVKILTRYLRNYGTRMDFILSDKEELSQLGKHYGDGIYQAEIDYLVTCEWAISAEDIIWRRSKLGLHISEKTIQNIEAALAS